MTAFFYHLVMGIMLLHSIIFLSPCRHHRPEKIAQGKVVKFYTDPATNSDDPEKRMAYGLNVSPPWANGGYVFVNLPEHLEYMPGTKGIARHHDMRTNAWQISVDSTEAHYEVESLTEPGVFFSAKAKAFSNKASFEFTITNQSAVQLVSIRPLFCFQYHSLSGFPARNTDNFSHTFIIINGKPAKVSDIAVKNKTSNARMAQVTGCPDKHNWWAQETGGMIEQGIDAAYTILTDTAGLRKIVLEWTPGKNFLSNSAIPCIHADPCIGNLEPGKSVTVKGSLTFTTSGLSDIM